MKITQSAIIYENSPINTIVCGIQFDPIKQLQSEHFGILSQRFRPDFPGAEGQIIVRPVSEEDLGNPDKPPLPRFRFIYENEFIQVEQDRFLHNWQKKRPEDEYPGYKTVIENFEKYLSRFQEFLLEENLGNLVAREYELTYIDLIPKGHRWESPSNLEGVFPNLLSNIGQSQLSEDIMGIDGQTIPLPGNLGKVAITIYNDQRVSDNQEVLYIGLNAPSNQTYQPMRTWFEEAPNAVTNLLIGESRMSGISEPREENTGASSVQPFEFLSYTEEDLLDWDAAIMNPPPCPSGTIRVKLKYKERSKPPENFWEE